MRLLILILLLSACTKTRYVAAPQTPAANPAAATPNHARAIAAALETSDMKCSLWTGRETPYPGVDAMMCVGPSQMIHVSAPDDAPPKLTITLQSESPPTSPPPAVKPTPTKPEAKKK